MTTESSESNCTVSKNTITNWHAIKLSPDDLEKMLLVDPFLLKRSNIAQFGGDVYTLIKPVGDDKNNSKRYIVLKIQVTEMIIGIINPSDID